MKKSILTLSAGLMSLALGAQAQTDSSKGTFAVSGYIDSYYMKNLNNPLSGNSMGYYPNYGATNYMRAFDRMNDQFALGLVQTKFAYTNKKSEMVIDLTFGPNAELGNFGNQRVMGATGYTTGYYPGNANQQALYGTSAAIKQAYFTYKATDKLSFTVGQFGTHIGYEVIDAPVNFHYSLSNLFNNGPFYHVGAKANYAISDKVGVMVGLVNNWDALTDWKTQKSFVAQFSAKPIEGLSLYLNYIGGHNDDGFKVANVAGVYSPNTAYPMLPKFVSYTRNLFDLVGGYQVSDKFYVGLNAAYGFYSLSSTNEDSLKTDVFKASLENENLTPSWGGVALYTTYTINDMFAIGARLEHFQDKYAVRYANTVNNSLTITAPITLADGHLIVKPEVRADFSSDEVYEGNFVDPNTGAVSARKNQSTIGCAFIYKY